MSDLKSTLYLGVNSLGCKLLAAVFELLLFDNSVVVGFCCKERMVMSSTQVSNSHVMCNVSSY